jgi:hypothetical protein
VNCNRYKYNKFASRISVAAAPRSGSNAMKRLDWVGVGGYLPSAVTAVAVLAAFSAWPSAGWSRTTRPLAVCEVQDVQRLLAKWGSALARSTPQDPSPVVNTYAPVKGTLVPTCANGPDIGHDAIRGYFEGFLVNKPIVTFGNPTIGGDCRIAFASGLYSFKLGDGRELQARYTYVFQHGLIIQHHSSLQPQPPGAACAPH